MRIGLGVLKLAPDQFWSMTVPELEAAVGGLMGDADLVAPLSRSDLDELMQRFPDA